MEQIVILDFGSQYTQVIARRIREAKVYCTILPFNSGINQIRKMNPAGIILSGGPSSVYAKGAPKPSPKIFEIGCPVLGICYGLQVIGSFLGGHVESSGKREFGKGSLQILKEDSPLLRGLSQNTQVWNSHGDKLTRMPSGFHIAAVSENSEHAVIEDRRRHIYGLQFHPEVAHTPQGFTIIQNFVHKICGCGSDWTMRSFIEQATAEIRERVGDDRVILGLSGGVDSSVAAALIHAAIGQQLTCIFVNNGLLRGNEAKAVKDLFGRNFKMKLQYENATTLFLQKLKGITSPERKRKVIGQTFIKVFESAMQRAGHARFLAQGTLYPDVIESVPIDGNPAALIKSHHNVGGLPKKMKFELLEPLKCLFKDEVRKLGLELGLPQEVVFRQPFPGPGLAVRILGEITSRRLRILREADTIIIEEMKKSGWYYKVWQSFGVLLPVRSVGVMGDERTYENTLAIRVVESSDGMTADWVKLPYELLERMSNRIINEVKGINRVTLDISSKPPATIEWE